MITGRELRKIADYNPNTGVMTWRVDKGRSRIGDAIGSLRHDGYLRAKINQREYLLHRLIWLWVTDSFPFEIDHINHCRTDNRIENLRECTRAQNHANRSRKKRKSLPKGVRESGKSKFCARIVVQGKEVNLGTFHSPESASSAYLSAARKHFGEFAFNGDIVFSERSR